MKHADHPVVLSPTDNKTALAWRQKCEDKKEVQKKLGNLPVGTRIKVVLPSNGEQKIYEKTRWPWRKNSIWYCDDSNTYITSRTLNSIGYEVL